MVPGMQGRLIREGVVLAFEDVGAGEPTLLFVHGWLCNRSYFGPQREYFSHSHRVVVVDLRGHGESDKPRQNYTMEGFADDLAWLCEQLAVRRPVVVGHSMGGVISLALAARYPALAAAIVMIDVRTDLIADPAARRAEMVQTVAALWGSHYQDEMRRLISALFVPTDNPDRRTRIEGEMMAAPQHVVASCFQHLVDFDRAAAAAACRVPVLYIQSDLPRPELGRFQELCPQLMIGRTVGAGHFNQLEVPDQVNAMIKRFLDIGVSRG